MEDVKIRDLQERAKAADVADTKARAIMGLQSNVTIQVGSKIVSAIRALDVHGLSGAPVVDRSGRVVGVLTEHDLLLQAAAKELTEAISFNSNVISVGPETKLKDIIVMFFKKKVRWLPVIASDKKLMGVVRRIDVLNAMARGSEE